MRRTLLLSALGLVSPAQAAPALPDSMAPDGERIARVEVVGALPFADAGIQADRLPYALQSLDRDALRDAQGGNLAETQTR